MNLMNNDLIDHGNENTTQHFALMTAGSHAKIPVRLVGTGI